MTGDARIGNAGVIKHSYRPVHRGVAGVAGCGSLHVGRAFAGSDDAVVATLAGTDDLRMIHQRIDRRPRTADVAGLAQIGGIDVRDALAGGNRAVVAGDTGADHLGMIHQRIHR